MSDTAPGGADAVDNAVAWAGTHKPVALTLAGGLAAAILFTLYRRRKNAASGTSGATAAGVGGSSLIPYGDSSSLGVDALANSTATGFDQLTTGFGGLVDAITGLTTTLTPPSATDPGAIGGADTGNTIPTPGAAGTGANTGATATPGAVPSGTTPGLIPTTAAPATIVRPVSSYTPTPDPAALAGAIQMVGGGVPQPQRTNVGSLRAFTSFDTDAQKTLRSGGEVVGGNGLVYKLVKGSDGTPHATSIGTYKQAV